MSIFIMLSNDPWVELVYPFSDLQRLLYKADPDVKMAEAVRQFDGVFSQDRLNNAVKHVVYSQEILRTKLVCVSETPKWQVYPANHFDHHHSQLWEVYAYPISTRHWQLVLSYSPVLMTALDAQQILADIAQSYISSSAILTARTLKARIKQEALAQCKVAVKDYWQRWLKQQTFSTSFDRQSGQGALHKSRLLLKAPDWPAEQIRTLCLLAHLKVVATYQGCTHPTTLYLTSPSEMDQNKQLLPFSFELQENDRASEIARLEVALQQHSDVAFPGYQYLCDQIQGEMFDVCFHFSDASIPSQSIYPTDFTFDFIYSAQGDIHLTIASRGGLSERFVNKLMREYQNVLHQMLIEQRPLSQLSLVADDAIEGAIKARSSFALLPKALDLFSEQVALAPEQVALCFDQQQLSYQELDQWSNALAIKIQARLDVGELSVAVMLARTPLLVASLLACWKAGVQYIPLADNLPQDRVNNILKVSQASLLIIDDAFDTSGLSGANKTLKLAVAPEFVTSFEPSYHELAYTIFTSGTTGQPKGVSISHRAMSNFLLACRQIFSGSALNRVLALTTISFDIAVLELFLPLISGGSVVLANTACASHPEQLVALISQQNVSLMQATPSTWKMMQLHDWQGKSDLIMLSGGEALDSQLGCWLLNRGAQLWNMYGPTEATVWVSALQLNKRLLDVDKVAPIGGLLTGCSMLVVDKHNRPVPLGAKGELVIMGDCLAQGYLNQPELTEEKFAYFQTQSGPARFYRTGDLVVATEQGWIKFKGRNDYQVKIRGYRIELGEIEAQMAQIEGVAHVAVVATPLQRGDNRLDAYWVPSNDKIISDAEIKMQLAQQLPDYMLPTTFTQLAHLPLNTNGKVDKNELPAPYKVVDEQVPLTRQGQLIKKCWEQVLEHPGLALTDDFYSVGGDSLSAIILLHELKKHQLTVSLDFLHEHPNLLDFIKHIPSIGQERGTKAALPFSAKQSLEQEEAVLLSNNWWFFQRADLNYWNAPYLFVMPNHYSAEEIHAAVDFLVCHHPELRANWYRHENGWSKRYVNVAQMAEYWQQHDWQQKQWSKDELAEAITSHCNQMQPSLELGQCLFRVSFIRTPAGFENRLFMLAHHLLIDYFGWQVLAQDLKTVLEQIKAQQPPHLGTQTTSVNTLAKLQQQMLHSPDTLLFMQQYLEQNWHLSQPDPYRKTVPEQATTDIKSIEVALPDKSSKMFESLANQTSRNSATNIEMLSCALTSAYCRWSQHQALSLNLTHHGRQFNQEMGVDLARTVGWVSQYVNVLLDFSQAEHIEQQIATVKRAFKLIQGKESLPSLLLAQHAERASFKQKTQHQLELNYIPRQSSQRQDQFVRAPESTGQPDGPIAANIPAFVRVWHRDQQLVLTLSFSKNYSTFDMQRLLDFFADDLISLLNFNQSILKETCDV
ncbi:amino acid adenylation domain-containing protein [Motilimonas cestriensis]|uniref:amino acid adenylation domain-containing protein n=1 Tax=Motilimonas cestriensis TaxID=2742685 RepID=UPI003DA42D00